MRKLFHMRVSRTTVISSASTVARLTKNVSEAVSFAPTKIAAEIVLQILDTIKKVDENEEARIRLIKRVVHLLLLFRDHLDAGNENASQGLAEKIQEFEMILLSIHETLKQMNKTGFVGRAICKEKIKSDLDAHVATIESEIENLNVCLQLGTNVVAQTILSRIDQLLPGPSAYRAAERGPVLRNGCAEEVRDELPDDLRENYEEVRICDVQLIPPEDLIQSTTVTFSDLSYALVKGQRRLIKSFDGEDEYQREEWLKEVKHWHRLKHRNILQMHGFSKKTSPHLYVVFQNAQARCLATYILDAFDKSDVPSISNMIVKMINDATSAIRHAAKQLHMNEAISVLVAEEATFALDSGDNLILSVNPLMPEGRRSQSLFGTLQYLLYPPLDSRDVNYYFTRLKTSGHSLSVPIVNMNQTSSAVNAFLFENHINIAVEDENGVFLEPIAETSNHNQPVLSAYVDYDCEVKAGDYGILVPGQEGEFSFQAYGNAGDGRPGVFGVANRLDLYNYMTRKWVGMVQGSPRVWGLDLNEAHTRGHSDVDIAWRCEQKWTDVPQAMCFLVNSVPLLRHVDNFEDLVLVTRVDDYKNYRFSFREMASCEPQFEDAPQISIEASSPLPVVYVSEPDSVNDELQISSCHPQCCPSTCEHWDSRVTHEGKHSQFKIVYYIRLRKEDIVERFGYVPAVAGKQRAKYSTGPIIRSNRWEWLYWREYELTVQRNDPWCDRKALIFSNEYP